MARNEERLTALEKELSNARGYRCDVSDAAQVEMVASAVEHDLGKPGVVVHNAVGGAFGTFREIDPAILNRNFQVNTMGLLYLARRFAPAMIDAGKGAIAASPVSQVSRQPRRRSGSWPRAMARELGPRGVHIAYVVSR
ncbi:SDR family NAD(P)-dependent oxidoreductase [Bradyrhizobium zhanjiangense]|uniref:SDR family NAD(P)-dependent oxidoreductase n=1 Tax=Bradyrhizobium zhanjiangense TaxID=1325107 RepID=UPI001FE07DEA|nr:SDR family oxidoreductase [Bradyrhizobium zhanjiangense]